MTKNEKKITIKDVAHMAGVSKGTVDRVVHERGEVSEESKRRVLEVIEQIGYKPNIYASLLATKKHFRVVCLVPRFQPGEYWELVHKGIERAVDKARGYNIAIEVVFFEQFDRGSFCEGVAVTLDKNPNAVMLAPIYAEETARLTGELAARGTPFVFIDSRLENTPYLAYYGMPMFESGSLAGSLLADCAGIGTIANFRIERGGAPHDNPTRHRRAGFLQYLADHMPETEIKEIYLRPYDPVHNIRTMDAFFGANPDIRHLVTFNSRVHLISDYLEKRGMTDKVVVGFDKLPANIEGLRRGTIKFLIAQRTDTQVYRGINAMIDLLVFHKKPQDQDNFMSMDILNKYNVDYYFDVYDT